MKKIFLLLLVFININGYSQKDSIINYLDKKGNIINNKEKAMSFEIITKSADSLWLVRKYKRSGKLYNYTHYLTKEKKIKIGESVSFNKNGKISALTFYNKKGKRNGRIQTWFDNGNKDIEGVYIDGKREGVWKIYHYNGKLAGRGIAKSDSIIKTTYYNDKGEKIDDLKNIIKEKRPTFKGGKDKYYKQLKKLTSKISYKVKGQIIVEYVIDIKGAVRDVTINEKVPKKLENEIVRFFENLKGWEPAIHMNRKIPFNFSQPLNFRG
ncbi:MULTISPECIES: toxin-antitoxin system YwqK family antitoxin [Tenacibaculum]|uniref:Antitoxin component YwqK of the YwqJK toxin-antitoxin module n=2 Tax=Tenacibaculum TaxID=104267 RepID=A0AAE9ML14_9FLAO|nr:MULTISPECIES: energy transducer TonB [Tenacibaculum]GFD93281.1 hypothetical protein KUL154_20140 [Alteromonas sp. KUL154]GFD99546.1 hypothetical protein KUL156_21390 [Alteromonas sp. KUL156]AZJ31387.1 hypothetical protein D6200_01895 [Tenacibaculum mesophilum]KAF9660440.1 hypothetical protein HBA12_09495 [Tenacibaculum mesophilum]MCG7503362.1 hypothetical protein [Tenacibaculum sp. Mcav3-52]